MNFQRSSGILLHVSSLPSYGGIGDMGPAAYDFIQFLADAKQHVWQVLPLCPTGYGNSPYASSSAFAGNPYLISLEFLSDWGWIKGERIAGLAGRGGAVDFHEVETRKLPLLYEAAGNFLDDGAGRWPEQWKQFEAFCKAEANWLKDYTMYAVLRAKYNTGAWTAWPEQVRKRDDAALDELVREHGRELALERVLQFAFALQWGHLREAAAKQAIRILGDVAIFVSMDSADVWAHPELFELDADLKPVRVAGVPPDYFSATGQRWGNPLYRWDVLRERGFDWWIQRMARAHQVYDIVRLDHFRGFEAYWAIPAEEETAINGKWVKAPGMELFQALERALGPLAIVAEDLGLITKEVDQLRMDAGFPGMRVMQFGFSDKGAHMHLPHQYTLDTVAYTGTHDNDTTRGWWDNAGSAERKAARAYIGEPPHRDGKACPVWPMIRAVQGSVAQLAIVPVQDLFEMGSEARMNTPAVPAGNWSWRAPEGRWTKELAEKLAALAEVTDREKDPLERQGVGNRE
ncbi:4-alpha-glucanotransferase [Occallatibacter riparius]|uniref:4-alpha-glucanotransferase n=1 Tax=Occallatibacter riparius TaxID=1002689 RepID=A0A9J7BM77_9BACT|nr:4-alpha-glucanotransferase [Occallatibacter riparius]UWZ82014.1 4-alpha-glucanotransferase [Occallatibacter riparius]